MHHVPYIYLYLSQFGWIMPGKMFPLDFGRTVHKNQLFCQKGLITIVVLTVPTVPKFLVPPSDWLLTFISEYRPFHN